MLLERKRGERPQKRKGKETKKYTEKTRRRKRED